MSGEVSTWARTSAVIRLTGGDGGDSCGLFGFDGNLPRRPFKLSVRTTEKTKHKKKNIKNTYFHGYRNYYHLYYYQYVNNITMNGLLILLV